MLQIANPVYDAVFKYLLSDEKAARLLLSAIIGREVISLDARPTELTFPYKEAGTVMRLDFTAKIRDEHGQQQIVIIEMQKAKMAKDIMRFRQYLGEQYANPNNVVQENEVGFSAPKALPILSIYFLGHTLERIKAPVLRVNRAYYDAATGEQIQEKEAFVESLTHDSIIIQIPYLSGHRRTELEQLLAVFDQSNLSMDKHFLLIEEEKLQERYQPILRRLQSAMADESLRQSMIAEDTWLGDIKDYQREIAEQAVVIQHLAGDLKEKEVNLKEKEETIQNLEVDISTYRHKLKSAVRKLAETGMSVSLIAHSFQLELEEVENILNNEN